MQFNACFMKGWRTLSACGAFLVTGFLSVFGSLDLTPVVEMFIRDPAMLGVAMVGVGALFGALRYLTSTPLGDSQPDPYASYAGVERVRQGIDEGN